MMYFFLDTLFLRVLAFRHKSGGGSMRKISLFALILLLCLVSCATKMPLQEFTIEYDLDGGHMPEGVENPTSFTEESSFVLEKPVREYYEFIGWKEELISTFDAKSGDESQGSLIEGTSFLGEEMRLVVEIESGTTGNRKYTACWKPLEFKVSYNLTGGKWTEDASHPESYTVETVGALVSQPIKENSIFMGWNCYVGGKVYIAKDIEYEDSIPFRSDVRLVATWKPIFMIEYEDVVEYGPYPVLEDDVPLNPCSYTEDDEPFYLKDPKRDFYEFVGWRDSSEDDSIEPLHEYLVNTQNKRDLKIRAVWKPIEYYVSYSLYGGEWEDGAVGPSVYDAEDGPVLIPTPVKENYTLVGWKPLAGSEVKTSYTLNVDAKGKNVKLSAVWKPTDYKIDYVLNGGTYRFGVSNPTAYNVEGESIKINNPSRANYRFVGWRIKGFDEVYSEISVPVVSGVYRDLELEAVWAPVSYRISYDLKGGYFTSRSKNLPSYTVETASFVLSIPSRKGYNFLGWVYSSDYAKEPVSSFRIDTSKAQNLEVEAVWIPVKYKLSYDLAGGSYQYGMSNPAYYTVESETFALCSPAKEGCRFIGWIASTDPTGSIVKEPVIYNGTTGDIKFTAVYEPAGIPVGAVTEMQLSKVVLGKDDIPRPDWVVKVPEDGTYHYERSFSNEENFQNALQDATKKGYLQLAEWIRVNVNTSYSKFDSSDATISHDISVDVVVSEREVVEYWEETDGTVWVLTRIPKSMN